MSDSRRILIVEDDRDLGPRLVSFLQQIDHISVVHKETIEAGLAELTRSSFDLLALDVMLPQDDDALTRCRKLDKEYEEAVEDYHELSDADKEGAKGARLRMKMEETLKKAKGLIRHKGGIEMLVQWFPKLPPKGPRPAILYLSAKGDKVLREEAENLARQYRCPCMYLVKPQSTSRIKESIASLFEKVSTAERKDG